MTDVDLARLGEGLLVGTAIGSDVLPVADLGLDTTDSRVYAIDGAHETLRELPPLPWQGWFLGEQLFSTPWGIVLTGRRCDVKPNNSGDTGPECTTAHHEYVLHLAPNAANWTAHELGANQLVQALVSIGPRQALMTTTSPNGPVRDTGILVSFGKRISVRPAPLPPASACNLAGPNAARVDSASPPRHADLHDPATGATTARPIPQSLSTQLEAAIPQHWCLTSGNFLAIFDLPGATTDPAAGGTSGSPQRVHLSDLDDPTAHQTTASFEGTFDQLYASDSYWAFAPVEGGLTVSAPAGTPARTVPVRGATVFRSLSHGIVALAFQNGRVAHVSVVHLP